MKRLLAILAISLAVVVSARADDAAASFNLATYNIRQQNNDDSIRGDIWSVRSKVIASLIRFHGFDIFGTQEGFKNQLEDLKALLPGYEYVGVAREDGKTEGEHSAIFYDTDKFELLDHGDFWLAEDPSRPALGWDAACIRICSWGKFRHKASGKVFQFYNLHLDHVGVEARSRSVLLVQQMMKEKGLELPTFLTGDFNVDQNDDLFSVLASSDFLTDAHSSAREVYELNGTFNNYRTDEYDSSRIDHIFTTDNVVVERYGVLTDTYRSKEVNGKYRARTPSDHFPVIVTVKF